MGLGRALEGKRIKWWSWEDACWESAGRRGKLLLSLQNWKHEKWQTVKLNQPIRSLYIWIPNWQRVFCHLHLSAHQDHVPHFSTLRQLVLASLLMESILSHVREVGDKTLSSNQLVMGMLLPSRFRELHQKTRTPSTCELDCFRRGLGSLVLVAVGNSSRNQGWVGLITAGHRQQNISFPKTPFLLLRWVLGSAV